jgi:23S rRNA (cytidine2498-2'-O)-methyltransferase
VFIFTSCQVGAETALKDEVQRLFPELRPAFSRRGFVSFKTEKEHADGVSLASDLSKQSVFARTVSLFLGKITSNDASQIATECWKFAAEHQFGINDVHVFCRDKEMPGNKGFEPHIPEPLQKLRLQILSFSPRPSRTENILDLVEIDADNWMVGVHRALPSLPLSSYAGGIIPLSLPPDAASRAWLKFEEGLRWSNLPLRPDDTVLDIGASPGGASQVLLSRGVKVLGIDPGEMNPAELQHKNFTHLRGRIQQIKRSQFKNARWLISDMNVAPNYTFDVLGEILSQSDVSLQGLLFTLKLFQWRLAHDLPKFCERLRRMGFANVRIKQLSFNRQEVMVAATPT